MWWFAPEAGPVPRRLDVPGAAFIAAARGGWSGALGQVGRSESPPAASPVPEAAIVLVAGLGVVGVAAYAVWERSSAHPMTPPRLAENRAFVGLNIAALLGYSGLSIVCFLGPFDLVRRRG